MLVFQSDTYWWLCGIIVMITASINSAESEFQFYAGSKLPSAYCHVEDYGHSYCIEVYSEPYQTSKMDYFVNVANGF